MLNRFVRPQGGTPRSTLRLLAPLALLALAAVGQTVRADDSTDQNYLRVGLSRVIFHDENTGFHGAGIPAGLDLETQTENLNYVIASYARNLTPNLEFELTAGNPPAFKVHARGVGSVGAVPYAGQPLISGRQLAPAFTFNYKFNEAGSFYRPFLGAGLVYSHFYDLQPTQQSNAINGGPTAVTFSDSFGLLVVAGVNLKVADHWQAHFSLTHADVRPDVTTNTEGLKRINYVNLNPLVYTAEISYGF